MSIAIVLTVIAAYFAVIFSTAWFTTRRRGSASSFYVGDRRSPWWVVAIAMIGTSISGVTFISVPGMVAGSQFSYLQMVLGFVAGYFVVAYVLLPLYYRLNLYSIYGYLEGRFGAATYRTGALFFLISKFLGCGVRMYLTALVLQLVLFEPLGIPFAVNILATMLIVWLYTFRGGVKTLVWTDMLQTLSMIFAVVLCIYYICVAMGLDATGLWRTIADSKMSHTWFFDDIDDKRFFWKQFLAGMFTTIAMTGLDQDMMQKNLSCRNLHDAQKNVISYGFGFLPVNLLFMALGLLLYTYAGRLGLWHDGILTDASGLALKSDELFAYLATGVDGSGATFLPTVVGVMFVLGLIAAAFSSAGSAVTALTTSVTLDMLHVAPDDVRTGVIRGRVHAVNIVLMGIIIYLFRAVGNTSVIEAVYIVASYTYGPLLGLYTFGLICKVRPRDRYVPVVCLVSPILSFVISSHSEEWFGGYQMGYELLLVNAALTMAGLYLISVRPKLSSR